jgi:hypothetical protein
MRKRLCGRGSGALALALFCGTLALGAAPNHPVSDGRDSQTPMQGVIDVLNLFPQVGALLIVGGPNDVGFPVGLVAFCSGTLIHERAFLTAGHCTGPGSFAPLPPFIQVFVSLSPNALDPSTWRPVVEQVTHPSIPPCPPPLGCDPTTQDVFHAPDPGISDLGLVFLAEPVRGIRPARLATVDALESRQATRLPMVFAGYGFPALGPEGEVPPPSEWDGWRRIKASKMDHVVDDTWASWTLPSRVCFGDSGGATFFNAQPLSRPFDISLVAVASDGGIDCISPDYRARVDTAAVRRWIVETIQQHVSGLANPRTREPEHHRPRLNRTPTIARRGSMNTLGWPKFEAA